MRGELIIMAKQKAGKNIDHDRSPKNPYLCYNLRDADEQSILAVAPTYNSIIVFSKRK